MRRPGSYCLAVLAALTVAVGAGDPPDWDEIAGGNPDSFLGYARALKNFPGCGYGAHFGGAELGYGGDTVQMPATGRAWIYDKGETEGELPVWGKHDRLVLEVRRADVAVHVQRNHLVICAPATQMEVVVLRHFCHSTTAKRPWNNAIEEIAFADGEVWVADALYAAASAASATPARIKPFSAVLPPVGDARALCKED